MSFNYPSQNYFKGIRDISFTLHEGEFLAVVGKSGSGKTTLLKCLYGLEDLHSGQIHLNDERILGPAFNLIPGHEHIKLVSQEFAVLENHTVTENIHDRMIGYTDEAKAQRSNRLLKLLELLPLKDSRAKHLSTGQKQRVAIARALALMPQILLLDEPFSNLDHILSDKLFDFISGEVRKKKTSVILITHIPEEALKFADRIAILDEGKIVQEGEKWKVYYRPKNKKLAGLLGTINTVRKKDLSKEARARFGNSLYVRPDKLMITGGKDYDLQVQVISSTYNGKCYELITETSTGSTLCIYSHKAMKTGTACPVKIIT